MFLFVKSTFNIFIRKVPLISHTGVKITLYNLISQLSLNVLTISASLNSISFNSFGVLKCVIMLIIIWLTAWWCFKLSVLPMSQIIAWGLSVQSDFIFICP